LIASAYQSFRFAFVSFVVKQWLQLLYLRAAWWDRTVKTIQQEPYYTVQ